MFVQQKRKAESSRKIAVILEDGSKQTLKLYETADTYEWQIYTRKNEDSLPGEIEAMVSDFYNLSTTYFLTRASGKLQFYINKNARI